MTTAAPPDPSHVSLAVARNAHAADSLRELQRILVQDSRLLVPYDHCALTMLTAEGVNVAAIGHQSQGADETKIAASARRIAPLLGRHRQVLVVTAHGPAEGLPDERAAAVAAELANAGLNCLVALPIVHRQRQLGSLVLMFGATAPPSASALKPMATVLPLLGAALAVHAPAASVEVPTNVSRLRRWRRWLVVAAAAGFMLLPVPFRVGGGARLAPSRNHNVYVELTGTVAEVIAADGAAVTRGEPIARLDDADLEYEIRNKRHQLEQMQAEVEILRNAAAGEPDKSSEFQLASLQADRIGAELRHLEALRDKLTLRSPTAGLLEANDISSLHGRRFAAGEVFCRVAPVEELDMTLLVPERDYEFVAGAKSMTVVMSSQPTTPVDLPVRCVAAMAAADAEHGNTFSVRARYDGSLAHLRPGMTGTGYVSVGWRPLGYVLLRKPLARLRELLLFL